MSAKDIFNTAMSGVTADTDTLQEKYANFLKEINYADTNDSVGKEIIFINRYLKADYTNESTFLSQVKTFCGYVQTYIATATAAADKKAAHKLIISSFADTTLFYPLKRTILTDVSDFTGGTNTDSANFSTMLGAANIASVGENATIGAKAVTAGS